MPSTWSETIARARRGHLDAIDAADARVVGVAEVRQPRRALAQRELEGGHRDQCGPQAKNLQQLARRAVGGDDAVAETIGEERGFGPFGGEGAIVMGGSASRWCNRQTRPHTNPTIARKCIGFTALCGPAHGHRGAHGVTSLSSVARFCNWKSSVCSPHMLTPRRKIVRRAFSGDGAAVAMAFSPEDSYEGVSCNESRCDRDGGCCVARGHRDHVHAGRCATSEKVDLDAIYKIKEEGFQRSKVMEIESWLTDVYGPRLTNSVGFRKAGDWAVKEMT